MNNTHSSKKRWGCLTVIFWAYLLQLLLVTFWRFIPEEWREHQSVRYSIHRSSLHWWSFIPALGLMSGPSVRVEDMRTGNVRVFERYDLKEQIYEEYPEVWPDKQE